MTHDEAKQICEKALKFVTADEATAIVVESAESTVRFANSEITQNTAKSDVTFSVRVAFGNKVATANVNSFDTDTLQNAVQRAEALASVAAPDTEFVPCPGPAEASRPDAFDPRLAASDVDERANIVKGALKKGDEGGVKLAGSYATEVHAFALANTKGAFFHYPSTQSRMVCTAMTDTSSGWAEGVWQKLSQVDPVAVASRAVQKAIAGQNPIDVQPGDYTVVLEPAAVSEMLIFASFSLDAKAAIEGRSPFSGKEGQMVAGPNINLFSDPMHAACPGRPFDMDGMSLGRVDWVKDGKLNTLEYDRYWSPKAGRPYTGNPANVLLAGGTGTEMDLVAKVDKGLLVTRFWYIRHVDPMKLVLTGMTRDGLFLIEGGKVTKGVKNLRFNESPLVMLSNVEAMSKPVRSEQWVNCEVPALLSHEFTFSSTTSF